MNTQSQTAVKTPPGVSTRQELLEVRVDVQTQLDDAVGEITIKKCVANLSEHNKICSAIA